MDDLDPKRGASEVPEPDGDAGSREARRRGFARRTLIEAGWTIPILAAASRALGNTSSAEPGDVQDPAPLDHYDKSIHVDNNHTDGFHNDSTSNHLDTNHLDSAHNDETIPHADAPHVDNDVGVHGDSGHADSSTHIDGWNHSDINHHFDSAEHMDMGHHDQPHTDQSIHDDYTKGIVHNDDVVHDDSIVIFTDKAMPVTP